MDSERLEHLAKVTEQISYGTRSEIHILLLWLGSWLLFYSFYNGPTKLILPFFFIFLRRKQGLESIRDLPQTNNGQNLDPNVNQG